MNDTPSLLDRARTGDRLAFDELFQQLYPELKRMAHARLAGHRPGTLMETTVLLHECWLRFSESWRLAAADRGHFMAYSARVMRSVVVDAVRASQRERRGGGVAHVTLDSALVEALALPEDEVLDIDGALADLAALEPRLAQVVEMRYFAGMKEAEVAQALGISERTVRRDWEKARMLLADALRP
ncbi:MAG: hypothetical protein AD742_15735 [Methylibium sp. NZG]|nr:MAG: hypothetical protein AD742_15735 [Methylibium sp. NZG]